MRRGTFPGLEFAQISPLIAFVEVQIAGSSTRASYPLAQIAVFFGHSIKRPVALKVKNRRLVAISTEDSDAETPFCVCWLAGAWWMDWGSRQHNLSFIGIFAI